VAILGVSHVIDNAGFSKLPNGRLEWPVVDVDILRQEGLLTFSGRDTFYLTPLAFKHYEQTKARVDEPVLRLEQQVHEYLDAQVFREQCTVAYDKSVDAERQLWSARPD
jgi:hypothetical protein